VQTLGNGPTTLYSRNPEKYFTPASNAKLLTTAAALQRLGAQAQIQTEFYGEGSGPNLQQLIVVGKGDPSINQAKLNDVARQLYQQGVRQIDTLVGDDSYFQGDKFNPTWEWEDTQAGYGAPINSLIVNENAFGLTLTPQGIGQPLQISFADPQVARDWQIVNQTRTIGSGETEYVSINRDEARRQLIISAQLRAGSSAETTAVAVSNPGEHFLARFQQALAANQIQVRQTQVVQQPVPRSGQPLAAISSAPLANLVTEVNRFSNNLYAEALLRWLGASSGKPTVDHAATGLEVIPSALSTLGVDPQGYQLNDGSGLSRRNLVSPAALVQLLQGMHRSPAASTFRNSLTVAATNGTLKSRFQGTAVAGQLQGKTGTLTDALALSGYLTPPNYPPLVFSIMVNQTGQSTDVLRRAIDDMVLGLSRLRPCG
jgi:D-alanyl-D-alanine carboxypeptidase/D-alanyl-D-alanine-endopeptidase (penicillin-binding protein 4)